MKKNILFLTSVKIDSGLERFVYTDLIKEFVNNGHNLYVVSPFERRLKRKTKIFTKENLTLLNVKTLNIQKVNFIEKFLSTFFIWYQFKRAIDNFLPNVKFDLIIYTTPPITFYSLVKSLKSKHNCKTYLLLKDIFPQNAVDLNFFSNKNLIKLLDIHGFDIEHVEFISRIPDEALLKRIPNFLLFTLPVLKIAISFIFKIFDILHIGIMINIYARKR